jgi:dihydrofolate reductase
MTRVIYDAATSLNGYIADEDHSLEWLFAVPDGTAPAEGLYPENATVIVEGSTTYEWVLDHERLVERPERWQEFFGDKPTFVFTTRELPVPAGADVRFVSGDVRDHVDAMRAVAGDGDIWLMGGGELAGQFLDAGLLDRIALSVAPAALTGGAPLLPRTVGADRLTLVAAAQIGQFARLVFDVR